MKIYIGLDPGKSGGVAFILENSLYTFKCPSTVHDMVEEINFCNKLGPEYEIFAVVEKVWSFPGQGVRSVFTFGENYGTWLGILAALKIPHKLVPPKKWMSHFGSFPKDKRKRKNFIKSLAQQLYPNSKITLSTSDAVMLAVYAKEIDLIESNLK